jgi:hypothetical protein
MSRMFEFGWWNRDPEEGKYQVKASLHGGNLVFRRHQGHHTQWEDHKPSEDDYDRLLKEAEKRVPRRLISPKQMKQIETIVAQEREKRI